MGLCTDALQSPTEPGFIVFAVLLVSLVGRSVYQADWLRSTTPFSNNPSDIKWTSNRLKIYKHSFSSPRKFFVLRGQYSRVPRAVTVQRPRSILAPPGETGFSNAIGMFLGTDRALFVLLRPILPTILRSNRSNAQCIWRVFPLTRSFTAWLDTPKE